MKQLVFSIYDVKAEVYNPPFCMKTLGLAKRTFQDMATDSKSQISKYPDDYALFEIGTYDDSIGLMEPSKVPYSHGLARHFQTPEEVEQDA